MSSELCSVCKKVSFKYVCPKCESKTCSLKCYKAHNPECTNPTSSSSSSSLSSSKDKKKYEDKKEIENILKREQMLMSTNSNDIEKEDEDEGEEEEEEVYDEETEKLTELFNKLDSGKISNKKLDELIKSTLTPEQQKEFKSMIASGALHADEWCPWWESSSVPPPPLPNLKDSKDLPPQKAIVTATPLIRCSLVEFLFAYVYVLKYFNGEWDWSNEDDMLEASYCAMLLLTEVPAPDVRTSLSGALSASRKYADSFGGNPIEFGVAAVEDVAKICSLGKNAVMAGLNHLRTMLDKAGSHRKGSMIKNDVKMHKKTCKRIAKKVMFHIAWSNAQDKMTFDLITSQCHDYHNELKTRLMLK